MTFLQLIESSNNHASPTPPLESLAKMARKSQLWDSALWAFSAYYGKPESDEARFLVLDRAYELGETFWDSAGVYGDSEDLLGKWFKRTGKGDEIFLATKVCVSPGAISKLRLNGDLSSLRIRRVRVAF